ncbi:MAG: hypothetical protein A2X36_16115 [Elusimicrobia bacterium GWA2_69_24]|nr:MAG: hypothetical protein A2X36_16115 [Elusimicrobia bacterium GWA2_69_24]HBL17882.1 hypothetical protein [Elusimicrobiota bacterium]
MTHGKRTERGFTLIELMVVVLIVGILAALSIPQYSKTVETAKADDAAATVKSLASAGRMFKLDHGNYVTDGVIDDTCNTKCCFGDTSCTQTEFDVCQLVACNYLGSAKYSTQAYAFRAGRTVNCLISGATCSGIGDCIACGARVTGGPSLSADWGYVAGKDGSITKYGTGTPNPPS